mmetsp:Transcript_46012/g.147008  ORF Transcript_46012/g.147008 Transcript_46012/m.147008 type:complete len:392 (+) Transcript_46012:521-1696(+)
MVEAQPERDGLVRLALLRGRGPVEDVLREGREGAAQVGLHIRGGFVGDLDARLQDALRNDLGERRAVDGLRAEEAPEVFVRRLGGDLELALELRDPALHEVHVVQEHPAALLGVRVQHALRRLLLPLPHRDDSELAVLHCLSEGICEDLDLLGGRVSGEKDEEDGGGWAALLHHRPRVEGILVHVRATHGRLHKHLQPRGDAVRPQRTHHQQGAERGLLGPFAWEGLALAELELGPVAPLVGVLLHVLGEPLERPVVVHRVQRGPLGLAHPVRELVRDRGRVGVLGALEQQHVVLHVQQLVLEHDAHGEERADDELVAIEEAAARVVEHGERARVEKVLQPLGELLRARLLRGRARPLGVPSALLLGRDEGGEQVHVPVELPHDALGDGPE